MRCIFSVVDHSRHSGTRLTLVPDTEARTSQPVVRELDWSILMAHAQMGERAAYRRLLEEITP